MKYLIILAILILILASCLYLFYKWYKEEQEEQDKRINILESRLENYKKQTNDRLNMEIAQRQLFEELTNNEVVSIYKQLRSRKKKSDKE